MSKRWVVGAGDGATVDEVLARMGEPGAASEGRAWVGGRRAQPEDLAKAGDELVVYAAREATGEVVILAEAAGLVVAEKPAAMPTTPDRRGERSLVGEVARLVRAAEKSVHAASRLDVGVSGVVLCAVREEAQRHVAERRAAGEVRRVYLAIAGGEVVGEGVWSAPIGTRRGAGGRSIPSVGGPGAEPAETRFRAIGFARGPSGRGGKSTLLRLAPVTGRTHQLRVHASAAQAPLVGDREHGGARTLIDASGRVIPLGRIMLHALRVEVPRLEGGRLRVESPVPDELRAIWKALDGDPGAWDEALASP